MTRLAREIRLLLLAAGQYDGDADLVAEYLRGEIGDRIQLGALRAAWDQQLEQDRASGRAGGRGYKVSAAAVVERYRRNEGRRRAEVGEPVRDHECRRRCRDGVVVLLGPDRYEVVAACDCVTGDARRAWSATLAAGRDLVDLLDGGYELTG